jgi:hypothetical protein
MNFAYCRLSYFLRTWIMVFLEHPCLGPVSQRRPKDLHGLVPFEAKTGCPPKLGVEAIPDIANTRP